MPACHEIANANACVKKSLKKSSMSIETARSYELNELDESHKPKMK